MNWQRVASSDEVTSRPMRVEVDGRAYVVVRLDPDAPASVFADQCPHRHLPLSAASVVAGRLRCAYHGWEFDQAGRCTRVPSGGDGGSVPPRAALTGVDGVVEHDGAVWLPASPAPPAPPAPQGPVLGNTDPALRRGWHPAALATELGSGELPVRLLGQDWLLWRKGTAVRADPAPFAVVEDRGLIWLAPEEPVTGWLAVPEDGDPRYPGDWLAPARTTSPAGLMADNFLDVAHFPFVHTSTFGAGQETDVPPYDVAVEPGGFRSVQEQWFANPEDPGVAAGIRPLRQRRRATYVYRLPFQLLLRLAELDAGSVKVIFFLLQPEDVRSTRVYTKLLVHGIGGLEVPPPDVVASELGFEQAVLDEDLALQAHMRLTGIPLRLRDEVHVRADRSGVALRRALAGLASTVQP
ncbi:MAG: Rieske 2Fe-2S domain-containing protein [Actinomycetota bacterium]|nr:Rieske 2Fe-2S domain-containing protein [Actinomycetota bacterium]